MKRFVVLIGLCFSFVLTLPSKCAAQDHQPTMHLSTATNQSAAPQTSTVSEQAAQLPSTATSDQATQSSTDQSTQSSQYSSSAYQPPPPDSHQQTPPAQSNRFERDHGEIEAFAEYLRFSPAGSTTNYVGLGGLVGFNAHPNLALEAQMSYDFARNFSTSTTNGVTTTFTTTSVRPLVGLFGPKLQFGTSGPVRVFVAGKVGFIDFSTNTSGAVSGTSVSGAVAGVGGSGTHLAVYPGGGIEMFANWLGLRLEAGDEVYLNNGTYNNLRVTAGPVIRF
jgi:hypothetical protein